MSSPTLLFFTKWWRGLMQQQERQGRSYRAPSSLVPLSVKGKGSRLSKAKAGNLFKISRVFAQESERLDIIEN